MAGITFATALVKVNIGAIGPLITSVINFFLQAEHVVPGLKTAFITPLLKKPTLNPGDFSNYRPISSKVLKKVVAAQLRTYLQDHSTDTALVRVTNDLLMAADAGYPFLLVLLDLLAAFDSVDHTILLDCLHITIGICDLALNWLQSYLAGQTECVSLMEQNPESSLSLVVSLRVLSLVPSCLTYICFPLEVSSTVITCHSTAMLMTQLYITPYRIFFIFIIGHTFELSGGD